MTTSPLPPPSPGPPGPGPWVERWLSQPRHGVYLAASQGDPQLALDLYEWNAEISAALLRDLAHLEVGLRNAYDRALSARWPGPPHWTTANIPAFAPLWRTRRGRRVDVNLRTRESLHRAVDSAGGPAAPPGKVIAELMFGFWRFLSSSAHEKSLWVLSLHRRSHRALTGATSTAPSDVCTVCATEWPTTRHSSGTTSRDASPTSRPSPACSIPTSAGT